MQTTTQTCVGDLIELCADPAAEEAFERVDNCCEACMARARKLALGTLVRAAVERELDDFRRAVFLACASGESVASVSRRLGVTYKSAYEAYRRARAILYDKLEYAVLYNEIAGTVSGK